MPPTTGQAGDHDQPSELQGTAPAIVSACPDWAPVWHGSGLAGVRRSGATLVPGPSSEDSTRHVHLRVTPPAPPARTVLAEPVPSERTSHHGYPREQARTATIR